MRVPLHPAGPAGPPCPFDATRGPFIADALAAFVRHGAAVRSSDEELLAGLRRGSRTAYRHLLREHGGRLLAVATRIAGDPESGRDALQEALLLVVRRIDTFEGRSSLSTWLHRIVVNQALSIRRRRARRAELPIEPLLPSFDEAGKRVPSVHPSEPQRAPEELVSSREVREQVREAIERLPERYRVVLLLRDIQDIPTKDVAEILELTENNVRVRLHRARAALKALLEPMML